MLVSLNTNIPRYFVEIFISTEMLGYFGAIAYVMSAGTTFVLALSQAAITRLAKYYSNKQINKFKYLLNKLVLSGFIAGSLILTIVIIWGDHILTIIYTSEYSKFKNVFVLAMIAAMINYTSAFLGHAITSTRYFKYQPLINTITVFASVASGLFLIPRLELVGAGMTLIISSTCQFLSRVVVLNSLLKKQLAVK